MRNLKKGFTLTEILVVIVIIGVIIAIAIPAALLIGKSIKERAYESKMAAIITAAELYGKNNKDEFGEGTTIEITFETLLANGYIDEDETCARSFGCVIDPRDSETIMNDEKITIRINKSIVRANSGAMIVDLAINFSLNGATSVGANSIGCQAENGQSCSVTFPSITRDGYTIIGWATTSSATAASIAIGGTLSINQSINGITYYAITSKNLVATFDKNTTSSISKTSDSCTIYNAQASCNVTSPTITATSGNKVIGWSDNPSATTKQYDSGAVIPISTAKTYYAIQGPNTYTCYKRVASTSCVSTSEAAAISACQSAGYTSCSTVGCASSLWTYDYEFSIMNDLLVNETVYDCIVRGRTSNNMSLSCTSSNIKELLIAGNDGIQDMDYHYCIGDSTGVNKTLYWNSSSSTALNLSESSIISCNNSWARTESGYTKWDYTGDSYLYGQTSCPAGYTATLE